MAIHLIKFLKTKGEEIEGISIVEETEKKTEVRRIREKSGETPNVCCKANEQKIQTQKLQETNLKKTERLPQCYLKEGKTGGVLNNGMEKKLEPNKQEKIIVEETSVNEIKRKLQEDRRRRLREDERFRVKNIITEETETVLQKERSKETKVLNVKTLEDKSIKTKVNLRDCFNIQKGYLNNTEKETERDKALQNILDIQKDQTIEKLRLNEKEKENFKDNNNTINKAPGLKECEQKTKCVESDQNKGKKRKADAEENRNKNEFSKEGTTEKCMEKEYKDKFEDLSKSLMVSMTTCAC